MREGGPEEVKVGRESINLGEIFFPWRGDERGRGAEEVLCFDWNYGLPNDWEKKGVVVNKKYVTFPFFL